MDDPNSFFRYRRQIQLENVGEEGQQKLSNSSVFIVGCGGLGTIISSYIVRAGVGKVVIVDPDKVELDNLQRQVLFNEKQATEKRSKAQAATDYLRNVNSQVSIEPIDKRLTAHNVESIFKDADLIFDGTDNMETRFLINEACVYLGIPWIYGGVVATYGTSFTIIPSETPCLRCFIKELPLPGDFPKCKDVGVFGPAVCMIASIEVSEGLKLLMGKKDELFGRLVNVDIWDGSWQFFKIDKRRDCPTCGQHRFEFLKR